MELRFYEKLGATYYNSNERTQVVRDLKQMLDVFVFILNYPVEKNLNLPNHYNLIGTLGHKYFLHIHSILRLISGSNIKSKLLNSQKTLYDIGSIVVLTRSSIENYLTFFYLFIQPQKNEEEEIFRFKLYELSGLHSRQWSAPSELNLIQIKNKDKNRIEELENELYNHHLFLKLEKDIQNNLRGRKLAKLINWWNLLEQADLNQNVFKTAWSLYSNYAHSEYLSQVQLYEFLINIDSAKNNCDTILNILFCLTSVFIDDFIQIIPETKIRYDMQPKEVLEVIKFFNKVGRSKEITVV